MGEAHRSSSYDIHTYYTKNIFEASVNDFPEFTYPQLPGLLGSRTSSFQSLRSRSSRRDWACVTFRNQRHMHVYAWLPPELLKSLTDTGNHASAEHLMQDFDIGEAVVLERSERARDDVDSNIYDD